MTVDNAYGRHGKLVVTSALQWEVLAWNFSMGCESGELICIKPLPSGANLILDRNWLTFVSRPYNQQGYNLGMTADGFIIDDDIPF